MSGFFGNHDDRMQDEPSSQGSSVWNDMPDDVLQEMQKQLASPGTPTMTRNPTNAFLSDFGVSSQGLADPFSAFGSQGASGFGGFDQYSLNAPLKRQSSLGNDMFGQGSQEAPSNGFTRQPTLPLQSPISPQPSTPTTPFSAPPIASKPGSRQTLKDVALEQAKYFPVEMTIPLPVLTDDEINRLRQADEVLKSIQTVRAEQFKQIEEIKRTQADIITSGFGNGTVPLASIEEVQNRLLVSIQQMQAKLVEIVQNVVVDANGLCVVREEIEELALQSQILQLYKQELQQYMNSGPNSSPVCALWYVSQPLPQVIFKGKVMEDSYVIRLLLGATQQLDSVTEVRAVLVTADDQPSRNALENAEADMDFYQAKAIFDRIQVSRGDHVDTVTSPPSYPFIVITNESQWAEAAGKLFLLDAFANVGEISWPQFINTLHSYYLKATRQEAKRPQRPLYWWEIKYFHQRFFNGADMVSEHEGREFWNWFGQCLQTIRFKRHINTLWNAGLVFGFLTKDECVRALGQQGVGSFILRFSESHAGLFGIAYVSEDEDEKVKHCLVKSEDIGSNKSLAEFLRDRELFQYLLRMTDPVKGTLRRHGKDDALGEFYNKKKPTKPAKGYILL